MSENSKIEKEEFFYKLIKSFNQSYIQRKSEEFGYDFKQEKPITASEECTTKVKLDESVKLSKNRLYHLETKRIRRDDIEEGEGEKDTLRADEDTRVTANRPRKYSGFQRLREKFLNERLPKLLNIFN